MFGEIGTRSGRGYTCEQGHPPAPHSGGYTGVPPVCSRPVWGVGTPKEGGQRCAQRFPMAPHSGRYTHIHPIWCTPFWGIGAPNRRRYRCVQTPPPPAAQHNAGYTRVPRGLMNTVLWDRNTPREGVHVCATLPGGLA